MKIFNKICTRFNHKFMFSALILLSLFVLFIFINHNNAKILELIRTNSIYNFQANIFSDKNNFDETTEEVENYTNILAKTIEETFPLDAVYKSKQADIQNYMSLLSHLVKQFALNTKSAQGIWIQLSPKLMGNSSYYIWYQLKGDKYLPYKEDIVRPLNVVDDKYYFDAIKAQKPTWTEVYTDPDLHIRMITYCIPIYKNGTLIGVAGIDISLEQINTIMQNLSSKYNGSEFYLLNSDYKIISTADNSSTYSNQSKPFEISGNSPINKNIFRYKKEFQKLQNIIKDDKEEVNYTYHNTLISYLKLSNDYHLIISVPENTVYKDFRFLIALSYLMFLGLVLMLVYSLVNQFKLIKINSQLEQQTSVLNGLFDSTPILITYKDMAGKYLGCNKYFADFMGITKDQIIEKTLYDLFSNDQAEAYALIEEDVIKTRCLYTYEHKLKNHKGEEFFYETTKTILYDSNNQPIGRLTVSTDIDTRKKAEIEIINAKEKAELASKARTDFLTNMSHEIRTPINGLIGYIQLALSSNLGKEEREYLEEANKSSEILLSLVNNILDFSKIDAGKMIINNSCFDIYSVVNDVVSMSQIFASKKGISLLTEVNNTIPAKIIGDSLRLKQVLNNLVSNSVKFTENGNILIKLSKLFQDDNFVEILFEISDTGIGISEEFQQSIFDAFSQIDSSTTRQFGGSGLGLTISNNIVNSMGGVLSLKSKLNEGSSFSFSIKFDYDKNSIQKDSHNYLNKDFDNYVIGSETDITHSAKDFKILIVEDSITNQNLLSTILKKAGFSYDIASNGLDAVNSYKNNKYSLVLMDCQMPVMDGYEATREIRKLEIDKGTHIFIIALTAHALKGDEEKSINAGMDAYLTKPIDINKLYRTIEEYLPVKIDINRATDSKPSVELSIENVIQNIMQNLDFDREDVMELFDHFLKECPATFDELNIVFNNQDFQGVRNFAHKLKGMCAILWQEKLIQLCLNLENAAKANDESLCQQIINNIGKEIKDFTDKICTVRNHIVNEQQTT